MLKIHNLFLRTYIVIFIVILIFVSIATFFWSKNIFIEQTEKNISQNIDSLEVALTSVSNIEDIVKRLHEKIDLRITIIDEKGLVIAESHKDKNKMDNHAKRYEIIHARYDGFGKIIRHSDTVNDELLYLAKKIKLNDKIYYIRMADYLNNIEVNFIKIALQIIALFAIFLVFIIIATYFIGKKIQKETDGILKFLIALTKKDEIIYIKSNYTLEFDKIARLLKKVAIRLKKKDKYKLKQTAKLKLANRQKDEIISAISHEFKNPIAVISGYSETLINDEDLPPAMKEKFLAKIQTSSNRMSALIDRLRLSIKLDEGRESLVLSKCNLKRLCLDIISDLKISYKQREIIFTAQEVVIQADETLLNIAISNLIENALKYSEPTVYITLSENSLSILDRGIGIEEKDLNKITNKFFRVSDNGWNNSLGLGLNIVSNIIHLHKFELEIHSKPLEGSEFIIKY